MQPETPLQTILTVRLGNNVNGSGNVSSLCSQWRSPPPAADTNPSSGSRSFFAPLEVAPLTWVNKTSIVAPIYSRFVFAPLALLHSRGNTVYLRRANIWERAFCCWFERAASSLTIGSIPIGDKQRPVHIHWRTVSSQIPVRQHSLHTHTRRERSTLFVLSLSVCQGGQQSSTIGRHKTPNSPFF